MCKKYSQKFVWFKAAIATFFPYNFERRMSAIAVELPKTSLGSKPPLRFASIIPNLSVQGVFNE
jgi:hypothetical protein